MKCADVLFFNKHPHILAVMGKFTEAHLPDNITFKFLIYNNHQDFDRELLN
jgi:hypothetical protein